MEKNEKNEKKVEKSRRIFWSLIFFFEGFIFNFLYVFIFIFEKKVLPPLTPKITKITKFCDFRGTDFSIIIEPFYLLFAQLLSPEKMWDEIISRNHTHKQYIITHS